MSQLEMIQKLRKISGAGMMDCKKALQETDSDLDKAVDYLREKGKAAAAKRAHREASEGLIYAYIHPGNKLGVLVEVNCETDFVARTDEFRSLVKEIAMQVAAANPGWVRREDVPEDEVRKEREILTKQMEDQGKPENIMDRIIQGKLNKFYKENCLEEQVYIRDEKKTVNDLVKETVGKLGENIQIARFVRYSIGG